MPERDLVPLGEIEEGARRAINGAFKAGRWGPGETGNPGGRSRLYYRARKLFQECGPQMAQELIDLAMNATDERVKSVCVLACLDRAGLKPVDYDPNADPDSKPSFDFREMSQEKRQLLRDLIQEGMKDSLRNQEER